MLRCAATVTAIDDQKRSYTVLVQRELHPALVFLMRIRISKSEFFFRFFFCLSLATGINVLCSSHQKEISGDFSPFQSLDVVFFSFGSLVFCFMLFN